MKNIKFSGSLIIIFMLGLLANINGCATENIQMSKLPETTLTRCKKRSNGKLNAGESCYADILAKDSENPIGLNIEKGQEYSFTVRGDQFWYDKSRINRPLCGEPGSWLMNSFLLFNDKKSKNSLWFSVVAEVKSENKPYDLCDKDNKTTGSFIATGCGMLVLYANDIEGFYDNNTGEIRVEILRRK